MYGVKEIGKKKAEEMLKTNWWIKKSPQEIVKAQLLTKEQCIPHNVFFTSLAFCLKRGVFAFELEYARENLQMEFFGEKDAPTREELENLIPDDLREFIKPKARAGESLLDALERISMENLKKDFGLDKMN